MVVKVNVGRIRAFYETTDFSTLGLLYVDSIFRALHPAT